MATDEQTTEQRHVHRQAILGLHVVPQVEVGDRNRVRERRVLICVGEVRERRQEQRDR